VIRRECTDRRELSAGEQVGLRDREGLAHRERLDAAVEPCSGEPLRAVPQRVVGHRESTGGRERAANVQRTGERRQCADLAGDAGAECGPRAAVPLRDVLSQDAVHDREVAAGDEPRLERREAAHEAADGSERADRHPAGAVPRRHPRRVQAVGARRDDQLAVPHRHRGAADAGRRAERLPGGAVVEGDHHVGQRAGREPAGEHLDLRLRPGAVRIPVDDGVDRAGGVRNGVSGHRLQVALCDCCRPEEGESQGGAERGHAGRATRPRPRSRIRGKSWHGPPASPVRRFAICTNLERSQELEGEGEAGVSQVYFGADAQLAVSRARRRA
jgi:hypothetical protein